MNNCDNLHKCSSDESVNEGYWKARLLQFHVHTQPNCWPSAALLVSQRHYASKEHARDNEV